MRNAGSRAFPHPPKRPLSRKDHGPDNLAHLHRFAVNLLRADKSKGSLIGKTRRAGWDDAISFQPLGPIAITLPSDWGPAQPARKTVPAARQCFVSGFSYSTAQSEYPPTASAIAIASPDH